MVSETQRPMIPTRGFAGWIIRVRAPFFTAIVAPTVIGAVAAWIHTGRFHSGYFVLTLLASVLIHAGANLINDYFDHLSGADMVNREAIPPFTGGSPLLKLGLLRPERARNEALAYFVASGLIGIYLALTTTPWLLAIGIVAVFFGLSYTAPAVFLAALGVGELALFLSFGPLPALFAWGVQVGSLGWEPVWASLPVAFLITNVLWINQFPDAVSDAQVGKRHWVVRLGRKRALPIYGALFLAAYVSVIATVITGAAPVWTLLALLTMPLAWRAWTVARVNYDRMPALAPANALTIQVHMLTGVLLVVGYLIQGIVR